MDAGPHAVICEGGHAMRTLVQELPHIGYDQIPVHDANELTNGGYLANIKLQDQLYTLRITRAGKLILTK
jgi:hypothetical protein